LRQSVDIVRIGRDDQSTLMHRTHRNDMGIDKIFGSDVACEEDRTDQPRQIEVGVNNRNRWLP
jgi:hypothetical protein